MTMIKVNRVEFKTSLEELMNDLKIELNQTISEVEYLVNEFEKCGWWFKTLNARSFSETIDIAERKINYVQLNMMILERQIEHINAWNTQIDEEDDWLIFEEMQNLLEDIRKQIRT